MMVRGVLIAARTAFSHALRMLVRLIASPLETRVETTGDAAEEFQREDLLKSLQVGLRYLTPKSDWF
jgi:hypothetical protein